MTRYRTPVGRGQTRFREFATGATGATVGTVTYSNDLLGRVTAATDVFGLTNRVTEVDDSKGGVLTNVYDNADRLTTREFGGTGQTQARVDLSYSNRNELTGVTRWNNVAGTTLAGTTSYGYDDASRVTAIVAKNAAGATLSYYNYLFDIGNRVTEEDWGSGASTGTHTYTYFRLSNELNTADGTQFSYDGAGNRTQFGLANYQVGAGNRVTNDGTFTYSYDSEANLTQKSKGTGQETWYYGYDSRNFLTSVRKTSDGTTNQYTVTYTYDALGRRVQQDVWSGSSTVTTRYAFDADNRIWAELNGSNVVQFRYLDGQGATDFYARINVSGNTVAWVVQDRQDNTVDVVDTTQVNDHVDYSPFGINSETNPSAGVNFLYQGMLQDRTSNIALADNRALMLPIFQWMQEDPIIFGGGDYNVRRVEGNNATNETDPSGLSPVGHHWNPVSVLTDPVIRRRLSKAAFHYAMGAYSGQTSPDHGYKTYGGVSHARYNQIVRENLMKYMIANNIRKMSVEDMRTFTNQIIEGRGYDRKIDKNLKSFNDAIKNERLEFLRGREDRILAKNDVDTLIKNGKNYLNNPRFFTTVAGAGLLAWANSAVADATGVLKVASESMYFQNAVKALNEGNLELAKVNLTGDQSDANFGGAKDSFHSELATKVGATAAETFKIYYDAAILRGEANAAALREAAVSNDEFPEINPVFEWLDVGLCIGTLGMVPNLFEMALGESAYMRRK